jgi:hypothetical protein
MSDRTGGPVLIGYAAISTQQGNWGQDRFSVFRPFLLSSGGYASGYPAAADAVSIVDLGSEYIFSI